MDKTAVEQVTTGQVKASATRANRESWQPRSLTDWRARSRADNFNVTLSNVTVYKCIEHCYDHALIDRFGGEGG